MEIVLSILKGNSFAMLNSLCMCLPILQTVGCGYQFPFAMIPAGINKTGTATDSQKG